ncbi:uncharacterized protein [Hemitrygon akajei]|uniref:uncharacterized protein n=1 Tax=Hemitrygon akajei TaxID=2704970 RepID=UPI003BF94B33
MAKVQLQHTHRDPVLKPQPWIPSHTSGLSVICSMDTKNKATWLEAMSTAYLRRQHNATPGQKYDQFAWDNGGNTNRPSPVAFRQRSACQRLALPLSIVDRQQSWDPQQGSCIPIKLHLLPFEADVTCTNTLQQSWSDYSWKPGSPLLRRVPSATVTTLSRPLNTYSASGCRARQTNRQLTSRSAISHLDKLKLLASLEVANGLTASLGSTVKPKPITAAESGSPMGSRVLYKDETHSGFVGLEVIDEPSVRRPESATGSPTGSRVLYKDETHSGFVGLEVIDEPSVRRPESATAGDRLHIRETTRLPQSDEKQEMYVGTDTSSRKYNKALPDVSKSPKMVQSSSGPRVHETERGKRAPPIILSMATASLVSLDTVQEQNEGVNNAENGLSKVPASLDSCPSAPQAINPAVNRKKIKAQRLPKLTAGANKLFLPKVVSGTTVAMHHPSRGPSSIRQPLVSTATDSADGRRQATSRKSPEMQEEDSECEKQQNVE